MDPRQLFIHRIRLRGPWDFVWLSPEDGHANEQSGTLSFPITWEAAFKKQEGTVRLTRRFNQPTGIDGSARVWLEVTASRSTAVTVNGNTLGTVQSGTARFEVTNLLTLHCRAELEIDPSGALDTDLIAEVALVIESTE